MIELVRIIEEQAVLYSYKATQNEEQALQLNALLEITKPKNIFPQWHPLIATPFRYSPPLRIGRFCPLYGKNVFYASKLEETALYEYTYGFMKQRMHLKIKPETGIRTMFWVDADDKLSHHIKTDPNLQALTNKNNYSASHQYVLSNPHTIFIWYPSCRDPKHRDNAAILDINRLAKNPKSTSSINYFYDNSKKLINWIDHGLHINWNEVK